MFVLYKKVKGLLLISNFNLNIMNEQNEVLRPLQNILEIGFLFEKYFFRL